MTTAVAETERAPESKQPSVSERGDPPEAQTAIEKIATMLPQFDPAFVDRLADRLKEDLNVHPPAEPPTGCDEIPTLDECKRIKVLYPKIDLNHENLWYNVCDAFDETIGKHGWECLLDVAEFIERWTPGGKRTVGLRKRITQIAGLIQAAYLCEGCFTPGSAQKDEIEDYFTAVSGSISVAAAECCRLLEDMDHRSIEVEWDSAKAQLIRFCRIEMDDNDAAIVLNYARKYKGHDDDDEEGGAA